MQKKYRKDVVMSHDFADCTATELLALFKSGAASPVDAHAAVMRRIELHNPVLKAFCHIDPVSRKSFRKYWMKN